MENGIFSCKVFIFEVNFQVEDCSTFSISLGGKSRQ